MKTKRDIKFRYVFKDKNGELFMEEWSIEEIEEMELEDNHTIKNPFLDIVARLEFTGQKDKSGKEIFELMEVNGKYRVEYSVESASYVLTNISNGDIIPLYEFKDKIEITREYSPIQKNPKGGSH